jgi:dTDP-4-dehydrorhamnose reductase
MKILITGITSIHGWPMYLFFQKKYGKDNIFGIYPNKMRKYFEEEKNVFACEIEDKEELSNIFSKIKPTAVIHAGGVCDLDLCEENPEFAYNINVCGARNIVELLPHDSYLMYISSDLVFSGKQPLQYGYNEECVPDPVSVVGKTYLQAEREIQRFTKYAIVRIGLPIGASISGKKGAVDFIEERLKKNKRMTLFYDEIRSVICTQRLAQGIASLFEKKVQGFFHYGGPKGVSLYDIGKHILEKNNYNKKYLIKESKEQEINGPPRIGDVKLNSQKAYEFLDFEVTTGLES